MENGILVQYQRELRSILWETIGVHWPLYHSPFHPFPTFIPLILSFSQGFRDYHSWCLFKSECLCSGSHSKLRRGDPLTCFVKLTPSSSLPPDLKTEGLFRVPGDKLKIAECADTYNRGTVYFTWSFLSFRRNSELSWRGGSSYLLIVKGLSKWASSFTYSWLSVLFCTVSALFSSAAMLPASLLLTPLKMSKYVLRWVITSGLRIGVTTASCFFLTRSHLPFCVKLSCCGSFPFQLQFVLNVVFETGGGREWFQQNDNEKSWCGFRSHCSSEWTWGIPFISRCGFTPGFCIKWYRFDKCSQ